MAVFACTTSVVSNTVVMVILDPVGSTVGSVNCPIRMLSLEMIDSTSIKANWKQSSFAKGWSSFAKGWSSFAKGWSSFAKGWSSFAKGWSSFAKGWSSFAKGWSSFAKG
eukprot:Lankesteria_metandrocarpae@DN11377_c0_g1_i1.p2